METQNGSRLFLYLSVVVVDLMAMSTGMMLSWTSPVLTKLTSVEDNPLSEPITEEDESWIGSLLTLGAVFSPFLFAYTSDKLGRKLTLILISIPYAVGLLLATFSKTAVLFYFVRLIAGFGMGGFFTVAPNYIAEVAENSNRGMLSSSMNNFLSLGLVGSYVIGPYMSVSWFSVVCLVVPVAFCVVFTLFIYETPYYLIKKGDYEKAELVLCKLRCRKPVEVEKEMEELKANVKKDEEASVSINDIFKTKGNRKALTISLALIIFQQLSGINIVLFYTEPIFKNSGSALSSEIPPMIIGGVQLISSFATPIAVDRLGRKMFLLFSAAGMCIAQIPLGLYFYLQDDGTDVDGISWLPLVTLVIYIIAYNCGSGPLPWTVMSEIFPGNVKSVASSLTSSSCWIVSFILTKFFSSVSDEIGMGGSFWIFAGFNLLAVVFTAFYVLETKGKSFEEIQDALNS